MEKEEERKINISDVPKNKICTGCGTCEAICPVGAISIRLVDDARYEPKVNNKICINCGLCRKVCPAINNNLEQIGKNLFGGKPKNMRIGNYKKGYLSYSKNDRLRWLGTSGGLVTTLLINLLERGEIDGALLVKNINPYQLESYIARSKEDIIGSSGAKYLPVPLNVSLREIINEEGRYAVVGIPCQMQGVRRAELNNPVLKKRIKYHFGLVCSHVMNKKGVKFIVKRCGIDPDDVKELTFRGKGWPGGIKIITDNEDKSISNLKSIMSEIFGGFYFSNFYCTVCSDHLNEYADVSFADAWIPDIIKKDTQGTSIIITRTDVGSALVDRAYKENIIELREISGEEIIKSQQHMNNFKKRGITKRTKLIKLFSKKRIPVDIEENSKDYPKSFFIDYISGIVTYFNEWFSNTRGGFMILKITPLWFIRKARKIYKRMLLAKTNYDK